VSQCRRIYTHQLNPGLVRDAAAKLGYPSDKIGINVTRLGNLSAVSTIEMLATDIENSNVKPGDLVAFSVAGAGPERGSALLKV
jgi:3-oxoacyl-[acyl-carrier-protein] synthase III